MVGTGNLALRNAFLAACRSLAEKTKNVYRASHGRTSFACGEVISGPIGWRVRPPSFIASLIEFRFSIIALSAYECTYKESSIYTVYLVCIVDVWYRCQTLLRFCSWDAQYLGRLLFCHHSAQWLSLHLQPARE